MDRHHTEDVKQGVARRYFCVCYAYIYSEQRRKNEQRAFAAIFKGCNSHDRAFRVTSIASGKTYQVVDVKFVTGIMPYRQNLPGRMSEYDRNYDDLEPVRDKDEGEEPPLTATDKMHRVRRMSAAALERFSTFTLIR